VNLTVIRDGKLETVNVVLAERPLRLDTEPLWLGIDGIDMNAEIASELMVNQSTGILVVGIISDGPADKAGLEGGYRITDVNGTQIELGGDIIISADKHPIENLRDMSTYISNTKVEGDTISLGILRDGKPQEIEVIVEKRPMDQR
jgi:S1-C subfamily serine protease